MCNRLNKWHSQRKCRLNNKFHRWRNTMAIDIGSYQLIHLRLYRNYNNYWLNLALSVRNFIVFGLCPARALKYSFILDENEKQQREKRLGQIIDEMRSCKRTPTVVLLKDKGKNDIFFPSPPTSLIHAHSFHSSVCLLIHI